MMTKNENTLQIKAAQMLASGLPETEVAKACGRSRSWVQQIKRKPDFQELVKELETQRKVITKEEIKEEIKNARTEAQPELLEFRQQLVAANRVIFGTGAILLKKIREKAEILEIEDIPASKICHSLKNVAESINLSLEIGKVAVGIDSIMEEINELKEPSLKGYEKSNGYQSVGGIGSRN